MEESGFSRRACTGDSCDAVGDDRCFVAASVAEVNAAAAASSAGVNLSEPFLAAVAIALILEAAICNRRTRRTPDAAKA